MTQDRMEKVLILAKTYPSPSAKYVETSCVAGITDGGIMRRLYPVPFRMIEGDKQFAKWQWIDVRTEKASKDYRRESHKVYIDQLTLGDKIGTRNGWQNRMPWVEKIPTFTNFEAIEADRKANGTSLALLRPKYLIDLVIKKARNQDWTEDEKEKLTHAQMQGDLFQSEADAKKDVKELQKVPFGFYYHYAYDTPYGEKTRKHKIVDWEAAMLYRTCQKSHGDKWQEPFRAKLLDDFRQKDLMFLMGNMFSHPHQWLIISLIYPPKSKPVAEIPQRSLF